jgi:S-formylglutathione hydrolase FrmB
VAAYDQHDPLWLLRAHKYPTLSGWFSYGAQETTVALDIRAVAAMGKRAGVQSPVVVVPGGHSWPTWSAAMLRLLPWLWSRVTF